MIGSKARIGLLIPSSNVIAEAEFYGMAPPGVTFHFGRLAHPTSLGLKRYENMVQELPSEVSKLAHAGVKAIAFACTTGSFYGGKGYNERIERQIEEIAHVSATSTSSAVLEALHNLQAKKIAVLTPYSTEVNGMEKRFLEEHGFMVQWIRTLDTHGRRHSDIEEELLLNQVKEFGDNDSDAFFLSCTGLPTVTVLKKIEEAVRKPVISSNQATMWKLKKMLGLLEPIEGFGSLLEKSRSAGKSDDPR